MISFQCRNLLIWCIGNFYKKQNAGSDKILLLNLVAVTTKKVCLCFIELWEIFLIEVLFFVGGWFFLGHKV